MCRNHIFLALSTAAEFRDHLTTFRLDYNNRECIKYGVAYGTLRLGIAKPLFCSVFKGFKKNIFLNQNTFYSTYRYGFELGFVKIR